MMWELEIAVDCARDCYYCLYARSVDGVGEIDDEDEDWDNDADDDSDADR